MLVKNAALDTVCGYTSEFPEGLLPQIAFAGKSNVGKSSLINLLMNRKSLARTSASPGKTQTINFYIINNDIHFVDLPGYGYAKVSKAEKEKWGHMVERYLNTASALKCVFLLVDIRHEPSANDVLMKEWIEAQKLPLAIVATKADKIKRSQLNKQISVIRKGLGLTREMPVFTFSSLKKQGREEILDYIDTLLV